MTPLPPQDDDYDPELDDILNDALNDFDTLSTAKTPSTVAPNTTSNAPQQATSQQREPTPEEEAQMEELARKMKEMLESFEAPDGEMADDEDPFKNFSEEEKKMFSTITEQMGKLFGEDTAGEASTQQTQEASSSEQKDLDDMINETLSMLNKEPESWSQDTDRFRSSEPSSETNPDDLLKDMLKMFSGATGSGEGDASSDEPVDEDKMYGILENMMQTLMSPDILHEPMQKLVEHYPKWLEEKRGTADPELYEKVEMQFKYAKQICYVYDNKPFPGCLEEVMELMKDMQECGQPPEEIVQAITSEGGEMPQFPSMPDASALGQQCPVQ